MCMDFFSTRPPAPGLHAPCQNVWRFSREEKRAFRRREFNASKYLKVGPRNFKSVINIGPESFLRNVAGCDPQTFAHEDTVINVPYRATSS